MTKNLAHLNFDMLDDMTEDDYTLPSFRDADTSRRRDDHKRTIQAKRRAKTRARDYIPSATDIEDIED